MRNRNLGFTLIELLVVVLIIGILAAVALPQYTMAVEKSRAAEAWTTLKAVMDAEKIKNIENGTATDTYAVGELAIGIVDKNGANVSETQWYGKYFSYTVGGYISSAWRFDHRYTLSLDVNGKRRCWDGHSSETEDNCKKLGFSTSTNGCISGGGSSVFPGSSSEAHPSACWTE